MSQYGDGDYAECTNIKTRRARKPHTCDACSETIDRGHEYTHVFFVFDGSPYVYKRCARCEVIYEHLSDRIYKEGDGEEFCDEELNCGHTYEQRWEEPPPEWLAALAFWRPGDPLPDLPKVKR